VLGSYTPSDFFQSFEFPDVPKMTRVLKFENRNFGKKQKIKQKKLPKLGWSK